MLAQPAALEAALAITLLAPAPPLMFMGEEWGAREPFPFFCDFKGELAEAVRNGRRKEFAEAYAQHGDEVPDPLSEQTVRLATLDWTAIDKPEHRGAARSGARLLAARKTFVMPRLPQLRPGHGQAEFADGVLDRALALRGGETLSLAGQSRRSAAAAARCVHARRAGLGRRPPRRAAALVGAMRRSEARSAAGHRRSPPIGCSSPRTSASTTPRGSCRI